jgi:pimeloyl-ACP methyl ester carboxylesterase
MASWRRITAPVLLVLSDQGCVQERFGDSSDELARRLACFAHLQRVKVHDAGHNLQHDQPERLAQALEAFLRRD